MAVRQRLTRSLAIAAAIATLCGSGAIGGTTEEAQLLTWKEPHMGTMFTIRIWVGNDRADEAEKAVRTAFIRVAELDQICSDYIADSEILRLSHSPAGIAVPVSETLFPILSRAQQLARKTGGAFDITIGPLIRQWRLTRKNSRLPKPELLSDARRRTGFEKLSLDPASRSATLAVDGMQLDLGGIAKGYAADAALGILREHGFAHALVAASGDIAVGTPPPDRDSWRVGIRGIRSEPPGPDELPADLTGLIGLANAAISTSGDLEQSITIDGIRYSHIVDPNSGLGLTKRRSVTVIAPSASESDSLATACSVLDSERALALIANLGTGYEIQIRELEEGSEDPVVVESPAFPEPLAADKSAQ